MSASTLDVHLDQDELANWRAEPVRFIEQVLIDPETKAPFVLLRAERAFLALAFKTDDAGRLLYPEQVFGAPKKSGKTGFAAMHGLTTTLLFGGAYPEAVTCANDFEQAQGRVFHQGDEDREQEHRVDEPQQLIDEHGLVVFVAALVEHLRARVAVGNFLDCRARAV